MKIEVWSDYVCPFCYIGKRRLENALNATGFADRAEVIFKAYQLDPNTPEDADEHVIHSLVRKYGTDIDQARAMLDNVANQAKAVGLEYNTDGMKELNTLKAHRLAKLAEQEGAAHKVTERLLQGYFIEGEAINKKNVLLDIAEECGIDRGRAEEVLDSDEFTDEVNADISEAGQIGVQGVPFFVINGKYAISGAQPDEIFEEALRKVADEEGIRPKLNMLNDDASGMCADDDCSI